MSNKSEPIIEVGEAVKHYTKCHWPWIFAQGTVDDPPPCFFHGFRMSML